MHNWNVNLNFEKNYKDKRLKKETKDYDKNWIYMDDKIHKFLIFILDVSILLKSYLIKQIEVTKFTSKLVKWCMHGALN